jgi:AcrR family transcriptional regulator
MYQDLIFESAEFIFGDKGFENATMQEVASEAGVSLKTVYASFPGKRDLYDAIMLVRGREMFECVGEAHRTTTDPLNKLVQGTRAFVGYLFEHKDWSRIHIRSQTSWAMRPKGTLAAALWDAGQNAHEEMLRIGADAGVFHEDDPTEMALMIRAMTRVQVVSAIERGEEDVNAIANRLIDRLIRMVCKQEVAIREVG